MISTRGRYAIRVMLDLAEHDTGAFIPMKQVAERQGISLKYIERIMPALTRAGLVQGVAGRNGGYRLSCAAQACRLGDILRAAEGDMAPVSCLECGAAACQREAVCRTRPVWEQYYRLTNEYFDSLSLASLLHTAEESE